VRRGVSSIIVTPTDSIVDFRHFFAQLELVFLPSDISNRNILTIWIRFDSSNYCASHGHGSPTDNPSLGRF
jgi:hypothetical protein